MQKEDRAYTEGYMFESVKKKKKKKSSCLLEAVSKGSFGYYKHNAWMNCVLLPTVGIRGLTRKENT